MSKKLASTFRHMAPKSATWHTPYFKNNIDFHSLDGVVTDWIARFGAKGKWRAERDTCVAMCATSANIYIAIERACNSLRANGKLHNHQSRVRKVDRDLLGMRLIKLDQIVISCKEFDELYDLINETKPSGIGPVTVYDVATRIAAYLKLPITSLYLHAGVQVGWNMLHGGRGKDAGAPSKGMVARIPKAKLPKALQRLPCDEVEDMLCCYRDYLKPWCA